MTQPGRRWRGESNSGGGWGAELNRPWQGPRGPTLTSAGTSVASEEFFLLLCYKIKVFRMSSYPVLPGYNLLTRSEVVQRLETGQSLQPPHRPRDAVSPPLPLLSLQATGAVFTPPYQVSAIDHRAGQSGGGREGRGRGGDRKRG